MTGEEEAGGRSEHTAVDDAPPDVVAWNEVVPVEDRDPADGPHLLGQVVGIAAVVALLAVLGRPVLAAIVLVVATTVTVLSRVWPPFGRLVARILGRFAHLVGRVLTVVGLGLFELLFVTPVAGLLALFRVDLLSPGRERHPVSQWDRRLERASRLRRRGYADERHLVPLDPSPSAVRRRRVAGAVTGLVFVAVAAGLTYVVYREGGSQLRTALGIDDAPQFHAIETAAMSDQPFAQALFDQHNAMSLRDSYAPFSDYQLPTFFAPGMNLSLGERLTYQPAALGADPLDVWVFGGSAAWGIDQRDEQTIPSNLAREAEAAGLDVHVRNFATPSYVGYQSLMVLMDHLVAGDRPDVVVLYVGFNEVEQAYLQLRGGTGRPDRFDTLFASEFAEMVSARDGFDPLPGSAPVADPEVIAQTALDRYEQASDLLRHLATGYGFAVVEAWQPDLYSKRLVEGETGLPSAMGMSGDDFRLRQEISQLVRAGLPDGVIDLSSSLDDVDEPVLADQVHTNELGAAVVGEALFEAMAPLLERRASAPSTGP